MARETRGQITVIADHLLKQGRHFSFVQAYRLLRHVIIQQHESSLDEGEFRRHILIRPELSLAFPDTDVTSIEKIAEDPIRYVMTVSFLGLYGTSSPLPTFYTEDLLYEWDEDRSAMRDFIDILNTNIYAIFFMIWAKYRLFYLIGEEKDSRVMSRLFSFTGLDHEALAEQKDAPDTLLRYSGLLCMFPRSAAGLQIILSDWLSQENLDIIQCVPRKAGIPVDQRCYLGTSGHELGTDAIIGSSVLDRLGKFRIQIGPVDHETLLTLMPDQPKFKQLEYLIMLYLDQPLVWDLRILLHAKKISTTHLGMSTWSRLGWNTWLFSGTFPKETASVTLNTEVMVTDLARMQESRA